MMYECPECGEEVAKDDVEFECPYCGETDMGEGFYTCENCETLFTFEEDLWECEFCNNGVLKDEDEEETEITNEEYINTDDYCPECGEDLEDSEYCESCDWPNNQGWIGEHYG